MKTIQERRQSIKDLEKAIENCIEAHDTFENGEILTDFVVVVSGYRLYSEEIDEDFEDGDEDLSVNHLDIFARRGQGAITTRGLLHAGLGRFRR